MEMSPLEFKSYTDAVLEMGAKKYGVDNWKEGQPFDPLSNKLSIIRHVLQSFGVSRLDIGRILGHVSIASMCLDARGMSRDEESGLYHLQHAMTRCAMELYRIEHKIGPWGEDL